MNESEVREEFLRLAKEIVLAPEGLGHRYPEKMRWFARIAGRLAMTVDGIEAADNIGDYAAELRAAFNDEGWLPPWGKDTDGQPTQAPLQVEPT